MVNNTLGSFGAGESDKSDDDDGFLEEYDDDGSFLEDEVVEDDESIFDDNSSSSDTDNSSDWGVTHRPEIHFQSSENMKQLSDNSVHLIVTSPPYNADWAYGSVDDDMDYMDEYLPMLARVFRECHRVLVPGGRMVVNVPSLLRGGTSGGRPIASDITQIIPTKKDAIPVDYKQVHESIKKLRVQCEFKIREEIAWVKGYNDDGLAPNGSFPRPWGILMNNMHEVAYVYQKPGKRSYDDMADERIEKSKISKWTDELCDDVWHISPDHGWSFNYVDGEDVPPFPEEFVKRCIAIWSYVDDTVLDPFLGRGTTCKVAKQLDRNSVGYELREDLKKDINEYVGMDQSGLM
jgi:site-specific DNA-methyltransferase (adenine-specific)